MIVALFLVAVVAIVILAAVLVAIVLKGKPPPEVHDKELDHRHREKRAHLPYWPFYQ